MTQTDVERSAPDPQRDRQVLTKQGVGRWRQFRDWLVRLSEREIDSPRRSIDGWGWFPALALAMAFGLLIISIGFVSARRGADWGQLFFWIGLLVILLPAAFRLISPEVGRREGVALVTALGFALYLVKFMHSPLVFTFVDEFSHWRTADDIVQTGRLFAENPLLPVSAVYPGQEIIAAALARLSGGSIFFAGITLIAAARLLLIMSLYTVFVTVSRSPRVAAIGTLIYMTNPNFMYFNAGFAYESVGLPAAMLVVLTLLHRQELPSTAQARFSAAALLLAALVVVTHHLTSYALSTFLLAWAASAWWLGRRGHQEKGPGVIALVTLTASIIWLVMVGDPVFKYLSARLQATAAEIAGVLSGQPGTGRELFQSSTGYMAPTWERLLGIAPVPFILASLPVGVLFVWLRYRNQSVPLVFAAAGLFYPIALALRFTSQGWEFGNRSSEFIFIGIGFAIALAMALLLRSGQPRLWAVLSTLAVTLMFGGGVVEGFPPAWRMPALQGQGADLSPADTEAIEAAKWTYRALGPQNQVGAESVLMMLLGSYGRQEVQTTLSGGVDADWIIHAQRVGPNQISLLRLGQVEYLAIDRRPGGDWRRRSVYYPGVPRDLAIAKFDELKLVSRIFDSGNTRIYDVRELADKGDTASVP